MRIRLISLSVTLLWAAVVSAASAPSSEEARAWIERMNKAVIHRNYDGLIVHRISGKEELLRIVHRMRDGHMAERVIYTDGTGHETVRKGNQLVTYYPENRVALVQIQNRSFGTLTALNGLKSESENLYSIVNEGEQNLREWPRPTQQISVRPRDTLRYGYVFWLDKQSAMPIKSQLVTSDGRILEEIVFTNLMMLETIPDEYLEPDESTKGFHKMSMGMPSGDVKQTFVPSASRLPKGFRDIFNSPDSVAKEPPIRFVVSDGVSFVSVMVNSAAKPMKVGPGQMDTLATYVTKLDGYYISVAGEVPPATARIIAEAFRPE